MSHVFAGTGRQTRMVRLDLSCKIAIMRGITGYSELETKSGMSNVTHERRRKFARR